MALTVVVGQEFASGTTDAQGILVEDIADGRNEPIDHICTVVSGTWKFGKNEVHASAHEYTTDSGNNLAIIRCYPGQLWAESAADTDELVIT